MGQLILIVPLMTAISYIATAANLPLRDATLLSLDRAIEFDFRSYLSFLNDRPRLVAMLASAYRAIHWQALLVVVALPLAGYHRRVAHRLRFYSGNDNDDLYSTLVPAIGVYRVLEPPALDFSNIIKSGYPGGYADTLRVAPLLRTASCAHWICSKWPASSRFQASTQFVRFFACGHSGRSVGCYRKRRVTKGEEHRFLRPGPFYCARERRILLQK
jgi:hypothetical protein